MCKLCGERTVMLQRWSMLWEQGMYHREVVPLERGLRVVPSIRSMNMDLDYK